VEDKAPGADHKVAMSQGGYRIDHPDGSTDIY
jgi:hypothetical protein